ncbi:uncharacterized protein LOC123682605 isoform X2 [Harmonia axyridis]|uniref:uncharacterized protein LOC123682605 isoform X2 n=1 Tax=Harmonia axyridis TaxID=115357 RepID=UPI001E276BF5|nr:uncharacterized protein LOC123682605 isoform X2 [Harmonia axyridis]
MMIHVTFTLLALMVVFSSGVPMFNRKEEYLRELAAIVQPAKDNTLLKKRTYGSLSLGGSYGTSKRGDLSLLRLGSGFGRISRGGDIRNDDLEVVPRHYEAMIPETYSRNKNIIPHIFVESGNLDDLFESDKFLSGSGNRRASEYSSKTFPSEDFNQAD